MKINDIVQELYLIRLNSFKNQPFKNSSSHFSRQFSCHSCVFELLCKRKCKSFFCKRKSFFCSNCRGYSQSSQAFKMGLFMKIVNGIQTFVFFEKKLGLRCLIGLWIRLWVPHIDIKSCTLGPVFDFNFIHRILMLIWI